MIRKLKADLRTLELWDFAELFMIAGTMCSFAVLAVIWSGNLP